jgi:hypothetical protein
VTKRKKDEKPRREHKVGRSTGYETDGESYWIAPTHMSSWDAIDKDEAGLRALVAAINSHLQQQYTTVAARRKAWWKHVAEDIGIESTGDLTYEPDTGRLWRAKKNDAGTSPE